LSPSSGGAWEGIVKAVKKILRFLLRDRIRDEESLHTFMVEVEWILKNRPLSPVSDLPDVLAALTPMALLSGCNAHHCHLIYSLKLTGIAVPRKRYTS